MNQNNFHEYNKPNVSLLMNANLRFQHQLKTVRLLNRFQHRLIR